jgi:hypothetical protein
MRLRRGIAALLLLTACGQGAVRVEDDAMNAVRAAGERTAGESSARMSVRVEGDEVTASGDGVTAFRGRRSAMVLSAKVVRTGMRVESRTIGDDVYLSLSFAGSRLPERWYHADASDLATVSGAAFTTIAQFPADEVTASLAYFPGAGLDFREDGGETVRGDDTTRYVGTLDLGAARDGAKDKRTRDAIDSAIEETGSTLVATTVCVDRKGRVRRVRHAFALRKPAMSTKRITVTYELYDFGVAVDVSKPAGTIEEFTPRSS